MGLFSTGAENVGIEAMTMGVNKAGMAEYREQLKISLLEETKVKLEEVSGIQSAVDAGWQGEARDRFFEDFEQQITKIVEDLQKEYQDLDNRLAELEDNYFVQDESMYGK